MRTRPKDDITAVTKAAARSIYDRWLEDRDRFEDASGVPWPTIHRLTCRRPPTHRLEWVGLVWLANESEYGLPAIPPYNHRFNPWLTNWFVEASGSIAAGSLHLGMMQPTFRRLRSQENARTPNALFVAGGVLARMMVREMPRSAWPRAPRAWAEAWRRVQRGRVPIHAWPIQSPSGVFRDPV